MTDFFEGMAPLLKTYWIIALIGSLIFLIIFLMTFVGGDADMEADATDFDADDGGVGFQFFTFKNLVAFFTIFGWTGIACLDAGMERWSTILVSSVAGLIMMLLTSALFYFIAKMAHSGTLNLRNAIGKIGEVYLTIGAERGSMGKVQIAVQGSLRELDAMTDDKEDLKSGMIVEVLDILNSEILLVKKSTAK